MKIVIDNYIPYIKGALEAFAKVEYLDANDMDTTTLRDADALIVRTRTHCDESILNGTNVRFIASATIGYDHIDATYCDNNGIKWTNAPGCNALSVVQYMASALSLLTIKKHLKLAEKTIGIVGVGAVGSRVAALAKSFGMRVLLNDPPRAAREGNMHFSTLKEIAETADIISFHTSLNSVGKYRAFHLADASFFGSLARQPIIINTSRGEVIDTSAMLSAKRDGRISEMIIDCWENEPEIDLGVLREAFLATPHIAGYSADGKANAAMQSVRAVSRFFDLGLDQWTPHQSIVPQPIALKNDDVFQFFTQTYPIARDDENLRANPHHFEMLRSQYPFRREPIAFLKQLSPRLLEQLINHFKIFF